MKTENDLVKSGGNLITALSGDSIVKIAEQAEKRIEAVKKIKILSLKVTNKNDWVDEGGKPYLQSSGAEKVARLFGISWQLESPERSQTEEGHFTYTYKGQFSFSGASIEVIGMRSSKSPFFSTRYKWKGNQKTKTTLPPSEVDEANVQKSALTNCIANGISRLLGIRNLTWEELKEGGIEKPSTKIEYGKKKQASQKTTTQTGSKTPETEKLLAQIAEQIKRAGSPRFMKIKKEIGEDYPNGFTEDMLKTLLSKLEKETEG